MDKLSTTIFIICVAFVITQKGCNGQQVCSGQSLTSCGEIYRMTRVGFAQTIQVCSGTTTSVSCINKVFTDCTTKPNTPEYRRIKNLASYKIRTFKQLGCKEYEPKPAKKSGGGRVKTSLFVSAVAFTFALILKN
ncbi:uncharacterized protein LOC134282277 [Saccostrea cucullata]|uniref:uncharacterized protein LOC134282277 n=1 Tax=Saccostrea cuccullata TaxID=36930 RepID=UPI002ED04ACD